MSKEDIDRAEQHRLLVLAGQLIQGQMTWAIFCERAEAIQAWAQERRYFGGHTNAPG